MYHPQPVNTPSINSPILFCQVSTEHEKTNINTTDQVLMDFRDRGVTKVPRARRAARVTRVRREGGGDQDFQVCLEGRVSVGQREIRACQASQEEKQKLANQENQVRSF